MKKVIFVLSTSYSGSTMLDMMCPMGRRGSHAGKCTPCSVPAERIIFRKNVDVGNLTAGCGRNSLPFEKKSYIPEFSASILM